MENLKPFDPADIDETLTRVVSRAGHIYLLFPYIEASGPVPKFNSIGRVIGGRPATIEDFAALSTMVKQAAKQGQWFISFNTPWLVGLSEAQEMVKRPTVPRGSRR
jgi:hypothetical protein